MNLTDAYLKLHNASGIAVGDTVKVLRKAKDYEMGWDLVWVSGMDLRVGKTYEVADDLGCEGFRLGGGGVFPFFVLELVKKNAIKKVTLNPSCTAEINKDTKTVKVGCQEFSFDKVKELYEAIKD